MKELIREELLKLQDETGRLTPSLVLSAAKDPQNPLHKHFEWDDSVAARKYRIDQARALIRQVSLVIRDEVVSLNPVYQSVTPCPQFVRDTSMPPGEQGYRNIEKLKLDPDRAGELVKYEFDRARTHLERAESIAAFLNIRPVITAAIEHVIAAGDAIDKFFSDGASAS